MDQRETRDMNKNVSRESLETIARRLRIRGVDAIVCLPKTERKENKW
ncbi:dihydrodipicolinate synthase/N-acetylneuraminate lyase [Alkalihalobacillus xiaoxiensis]|uniref:Dihydrodipicolinate synthase/N-acetylneuraminate lyase n=1 Tax=Shouchella xiaoxiensis TaxID=766895 RepID=A0ABS2SZM6_9BACI|nr:hypothetical protein [Shouchella xiaoxiensis]MBM7839697.1 dihydrodipicolinate synthase/N-acetylneuraminate lyase [Shouchella xiaoxiensis]